MVHELLTDPVLVVFAVFGVGAAGGALRVRGFSFGPAAALFGGLAAGAIDHRMSTLSGLGLLRELGLVLFTYTVGLASGPTFVAGLRRGGGRAVAVTVALVGALGLGCAGIGALFGLDAADRAGLFAGSATNTPALQAAGDALAAGESAAGAGDPVVAYSITYPVAVLSMLVVITLLAGRRLPLPARLEPAPPPPHGEHPVNWTVRVTMAHAPTLDELAAVNPGIGFSRIEHDGVVRIATGAERLLPGDAVVLIGPRPQVAELCDALGRRSDRHLPLDRSSIDFRRIVVSNRALAGRSLAGLDLGGRFGATVTRVRRGDDDLVAHPDLVLQLGDRVRVVGPVAQLARVAELLGDSERRLSEVDAVGLAAGIVAGLALGAVSMPLPGGVRFALGAGGGPLVAGLVLGTVSRTGPVTWQLPHGANLVLRQLGIGLFLAAAGLGAGATFADAVLTRHGLTLLAAGAVLAAAYAAAVPLAVQVLLRRDVHEAAGMLAGMETQPAALAYAGERSGGDERVNAAYALVFPAAMIAKIVVVQLLV
ncbi:MAG: TrkA C-terminal domain-containing protein [Acidimicrobiia bacterium]